MTNSAASAKLFVLDSNVILHDSRCIHAFHEHDIAIPLTVLEELDRFKKGQSDINYQAREFLRALDELTGDVLSPVGASLGPGKGNIRVVWGNRQDERLKDVFLEDSADHRIVNDAFILSREATDQQVILVTKDTNVRMKAKALGLVAQDFIRGTVESVEKLYSGRRTVETTTEEIDAFYRNGASLPAADAPTITDAVANETFILRNGSKSVLASYDADEKTFRRIDKVSCYGIKPRNAEQSFALAALINPNIKLVTLVGKAGTGKTLLALAAALQTRRDYRQVLLARPIVPLSNRDIGFLPGDVRAKLDPYMQPLYDNLTVIRHQFAPGAAESENIQKMLDMEKLVISPLAYIRGRSLQKIFFIVDEAQNLTPHEVKTIITRAGEGTKIVFTGDIHQIDHPYLDKLSNGLSYLINRMVGHSLYSHITLEKGERSILADLATEIL